MTKTQNETQQPPKRQGVKRFAIIAIIIILAVLTGITVVFAGAKQEIVEIDGFYCVLSNRGTYTIVGLNGLQQSTTLLIPERLGEKEVDELAGAAFSNSGMKHFIVPSSIKYIGKNAFDGEGVFYIYMVGRKNLDNMNLKENWSGVGEVIFQDVNPNIDIPPTVKEVDEFVKAEPPKNTDKLEVEGDLDGTPLPEIKNEIATDIDGSAEDENFTKEQIRTLSRLEILNPPTKTAYIERQYFDKSGMIVKATYDDGFSQLITGYTFQNIPLPIDMTSVVISYTDNGTCTVRVPITVQRQSPVKLIIKTPPTKIQYVELEKFDSTGMVVTCEYNNGESHVITDYKYPNDSLVLNQQEIKLSYIERGSPEVTVTQKISVIQKVPIKLVIKTKPTKTEYIENTDFDPSGMVLEAEYNNGMKAPPRDFTYNKEKIKVGQKEVVITYRENGATVTASQAITVRKRQPTRLAVATPPTKTDYIEVNLFDKAGMVVESAYDNGDKSPVINYTYSPTGKLTINDKEIVIAYEENGAKVKTSQPIKVRKKLPTKLAVTTPPTKTNYIEGNLFEKTGMAVTATFDNGDVIVVSDYTYTPTGKLTIADKAVIISYTLNGGTVTTTTPIKVRKKLPTKLEVTTPPTKTNYIEGNLFEKTGMAVTATFDNGDVIVVSDYSYSPIGKLTIADKAVTISYTLNGATVTTTTPIKVVLKKPTKIVIKTPPTKTEYIEGEVFDPTGMVIEVTYDNGDIAIVNNYTYPKEPVVFEQTVVTLLHEENGSAPVTVNQPITVLPAIPNSISIQTPPYKTLYNEGERFDKTGMVVVGNYKGGSTKVITDYTYQASIQPEQEFVTISYTSRGVTRTVNCSISVVTNAKWFTFNSSTGTITKFNATENYPKVVVIPSHINGVAVRAIGEYAFVTCTPGYPMGGIPLTSVIIPEGVTELEQCALWRTNLESITLPESLRVIGQGALENLNVRTLKIPNGVTTLGLFAIGSCLYLENVELPNTLASILQGAFNSCISLKTITIPSSVIKMDIDVFNRCYNLETIYVNKPAGTISGAPWYSNSAAPPANYCHAQVIWRGYAAVNREPVVPKEPVAPPKKPQEKPYVEEKSISTYEKWTVKDGKKQTLLAQVQAPTGSLPKNGLHTDGSWYVLQSH